MTENVKFYALNSFPSGNRMGSFLHLKADDGQHSAGLYFCDGGGWKYLTNVSQDTSREINSAKIFDGEIYFFNEATPPATKPTSTSGYLLKLDCSSLYTAGDGINFDSGAIEIDIAKKSVTDGGNTPNTSSPNILTIDTNKKLSISDTWGCGEYDDNIKRHVTHLKTQNVVYVRIKKFDIPDGITVTRVASLPESPTTSSDEYVQVTSNNWYYKLSGKHPAASSLKYGEISISYAKGYERIFIKNGSDEIIEFEPARNNRNIVTNATFVNGALTSTNNVCSWTIPYSDIEDAGIGPNGAVLFLREKDSGKQLIPDVLFDDTNRNIIISLYSSTNIAANKYTAIVMGSKYNN